MLAVRPIGRPVSGRVRPPGSKSLTNRALVAAAMAAPGASRIIDPLEADDTAAMRRALRSLGVLIDDVDQPWLVRGASGELAAPDAPIDAGASGTTARFITAVCSVARGRSVIDGTERMRQRPIGPLVEALASLGVTIGADNGFPPVRVEGGTLRGGTVTVDARQSSQFASALLLIAPLASEPVQISLLGPVVSRPYLAGTLEVMRAFGATVVEEGDDFVVGPTGYRKAHYQVEADASAAVYPAVAAAITGGEVSIQGIPPHSTQPDLAVLDVLASMGCSVAHGDDVITVEGPEEGLAPVEVDMSGSPDGAMAVAVAALFAGGESRIGGLSTLRLKETDRLDALERELTRVGGQAHVDGDTLVVRPGRLHAAEVETYDDHRMAMAMALVGLVEQGIVIRDPGTVSKTWPGFFDMLASL